MACLAVPGAGASLHHQALGDLPGIAFMPEAPWGRATRWLTVITVDPAKFGADREAIRLALEDEAIEARPLWKPMHLQPVFADCPYYGDNTEGRLFDNGLCLPSGPTLTDEDIERVVNVIKKCIIKNECKKSAFISEKKIKFSQIIADEKPADRRRKSAFISEKKYISRKLSQIKNPQMDVEIFMVITRKK